MPEEVASEVQATETPSTVTTETAKAVDNAPQTESVTPEAPAYTPNYKFKYAVEGQPSVEKEFDEFVRLGIKDKETEEKARELYAKAYGLDFVKPKYEEYKKNYPELESKYKQLDGTVSEILEYKDKGDLDTFFKALRLPEEQVAKWMLEKIKRMELPPEQQQMYNQFEETKRQNQLLQRQFQELNGMTQNQAVQNRTMELETNLQKPEVNSFVSAFDTARGKQGAFRQEVQECGLYEWKVNGVDISASEAISRVMSRYNGMITPQISGENSQQPAVEKQLPVIPRLNGTAVSATGKRPRSIDDLRKKYTEMSA